MQAVNKLWFQVLYIRTFYSCINDLRDHWNANFRGWERERRGNVLHELLLEVAVPEQQEAFDALQMQLKIEFFKHHGNEFCGCDGCGLWHPISYVVVLIDGSWNIN